MELLLAESDKRIIKLGLWLMRKKLGESANKEKIHEDMLNCGNFAVKELAKVINDAASKINEKYQKEIVTQLSEFGLWICYKDTAYRDIFFWIINEILKNPDKYRELIKPYVKNPDKWHVNVWSESKNLTKKLREEGKIPKTAFSTAESVHVPSIQRRRIEQLYKNKYKNK